MFQGHYEPPFLRHLIRRHISCEHYVVEYTAINTHDIARKEARLKGSQRVQTIATITIIVRSF
jgi:hypothetical protein